MDGFTRLDPVLLDLLVEWDERKASGNPVTPEELCRGCPEWLDELRRHVEQIAGLDPVLALTGPGEVVWPAIPGFELLDEIGRGGMGVVYRARDLALDWIVAVKLPFGAGGAAVSRVRFEREAQTLAKLRHPGIVPVHAAGVAHGTPYFVMEHMGGGNLAERMGEVAGTPGRAATLLSQLALAVAHAHAAGFVHRDLKPSNILLDDAGRPFVSDFGVAALLAGDSLVGAAGDTPAAGGPTRVTRTGERAGTPAYAAPEQYDPARFGGVGPATDIWALGVILYEMLAHGRPFVGQTWEELRAPVCDGTIPPVRGLSRRLRRVINRCLAKESAGRYRTATELAEALSAVSPKRGRWSAGVLAAVAALGGVGYAVSPPSGKLLDDGRSSAVRATWPDFPSVREAHDRLARGEDVDLIRSDIARPAFDLATGPGSGNVFSPVGEPLHVVSASPVGCLVELLPALPAGRYRVEGELFHETGNGMSWVGLYAGASHCQIPRGRQHFLMTAQYSDRGSTAEEQPGTRRVTANRRTYLLAQYLGDPDNALTAGYACPADHPGGNRVPAPAVGWRRVSLIVDGTGFQAAQADTAVGSMNLGEVENTLAEARQRYPDLPGPEWPVYPHGGVGLYVHSGSLRVKLFRVTPLRSGK